jgi:predicted ATP-dependent endonuclease of OLD family
MRLLYVENFRGFKSQFIPLNNVNFFLGENSSGKSSILGLINLFTSPQLWLRQDFNTDEYQFGNYSDIISINEKTAKYFRIGLIECTEEEMQKGKSATYSFLMEFSGKNGVPIISKYFYINQSSVVKILFENKKIYYKVNQLEPAKKTPGNV